MFPNIAFFDSGQGGLTIWEKVIQLYPNLNTVYLGDNARCPYGSKSPETIIQYTRQAAQFLTKQNAQFIAVVCGTASSVAKDQIANEFQVPIVGIVEGLCEYAANHLDNKNRPVVVLATHFTIQSQRFQNELKTHNVHNVWAKACPLFVPLIEDGISDGPLVRYACERYLKDIPLDVKIVMLACTHYPRLINALSQYLTTKTGRPVILKTLEGEKLFSNLNQDAGHSDPIYLLEASLPIVNEIKNYITASENAQTLMDGRSKMFCTDAPVQFCEVAHNFTKLNLPKIELARIAHIQ